MNKQKVPAYRQGDVILKVRPALPSNLTPAKDRILAHGETSGHAHFVSEEKGTHIFVDNNGKMWIQSDTEFAVEHLLETSRAWTTEHHPVMVPPGVYEVTISREYDAYEETVRRVQD